MAAGGQRLHAWAMERLEPRDQAELEVSDIGAMIASRRRTYDTFLPWWPANGPTGEGVPLFVVTDPARRP
jgi:hypothetical protein